MYGSYSSYSSSYGTSTPMDIRPSYLSSRPQDDASSCAFPAWPRRTSLCGDEAQQRATSFLSDEDLEPLDPCRYDDDDARSISSAGTASPTASPRQAAAALAPAALLTEADFLELERQQAAYQREVMRFLLNEKSKRQAMRRQRRGSAAGAPGSRKSSPKGASGGSSKLAAMTPIAEAGE